MKKSVVILLAGLLAVVGGNLFSQNVDCDFSDPGKFTGEIKRAVIENGVLSLKRDSSATLKLDAEKPFQISFRYRIAQSFEAKSNNNHMTVWLAGDGTQSVSMHFFLKTPIMCYVRKNDQTKAGAGLPNGCKFQFEENKWYDIAIDVWRDKFNISIDKQNLIALKHEKLLPVRNLVLTAYKLDAEIDDLKIGAKQEEIVKTIDKPVFTADFQKSLSASDENGKAIEPEKAADIAFVKGVEGEAAAPHQGKQFKGDPLTYPLNDPFDPKAGGIMFWVKTSQPGELFKLTDDNGTAKMTVSIGGPLSSVTVQVKQTGDKSSLAYIRSVPGNLNDWFHVALTWDKDLNARYFINGLPYWVCFKPGQRCPDFLNANVEGIKKLVFSNKSDAAFDRVRIFRRTLANHEIYQEYRSVMPVDLVMGRTIVDEDVPVKIQVQVAPGGFYMRPMPVETDNFISADTTVKFELMNEKNEVKHSETQNLKVDRPLDIELKELRLPRGNYTLVATVDYSGKSYQRTLSNLTAFTQKYKPAVSKDPLKVGKLLYQRKLDKLDSDMLSAGGTNVPAGKGYLQAGPDKGDRFCFEIPFDKEFLGKPVILEMTWPDDAVRSMAWYMYPKGIVSNRDRLQTGVQAGIEFPNSGEMITTRHVFFPGMEKYLFEARTMAAGMPAAVAEVKVYAVDGELPKLAVRLPDNLPGRRYGHYDEDQTFTNNLNADVTSEKSPMYSFFEKEYAKNGTAFFTDELVRYFGYTGMNTMHYPVWRYSVGFIPIEGHTDNGLYPGKCGELSYVFDSFAKNDLKFIAIMDYYNLPDMAWLEKIESDYVREGMVMLDRYGDNIKTYSAGNHRANICNPKTMDMFARYFEDPVKRYSRIPGFDGIQYFLAHFGSWMKLDYGYDDYTVGKFSKETGVKVPEKLTERYDFLTKAPVRDTWLKWRAEQVTNLVKRYRAVLDKYNPNLKFLLCIPQDENNYTEQGIDCENLKKIPGVIISIARHPTAYRHAFHWGNPESELNEKLYNFHSADLKNYLQDGAASSVMSVHSYFETFVHPLHKDYNCYFENSDVKAHGRYFLREFAFSVGALDAQEYTLGGQPLCAIGREDESREFAQAYCSLPAKPFTIVPGICDPTIARTLNTANGTYFYVVNMFHYPVKVKFSVDKKTTYEDLSTGEKITDAEIELKPFQLRSFLFQKEKVSVSGLALSWVPQEADAFYQKRIADLAGAAEQLRKNSVDISEEEKTIARLQLLLKEKQYAELYRLAFSKAMNQLLLKMKNLSAIIKQQR